MPAENAGRAFALVLVDELVRHGVRHAVVAPGSRSTPVALALLERDEIEVHVRIDERSAAFLALGIAKASGQVVPVLCTSGTATAHFLAAIMEADQSRVPLLAITADRPAELHGIGANQTVEQRGMYEAYVRASYDVPAPESAPGAVDAWRAVFADALSQCLGADRGPVHLNLGLREPLLPVDDSAGFPHDLGIPASPVVADPAVAGLPGRFVERVSGVRRGLIVAGAGTPETGAILNELAERGDWIMIAEPHSCARVVHFGLRASDPILRDPEFVKDHRPDLVLVVGRVGLSRTLLSWLESVPHVVVSLDGGHWDVTRTALDVVQCTPEVLRTLELPKLAVGWNGAWRAADFAAYEAIADVVDAAPTLSEPEVARVIGDLADDAYDNLVVASSMPIRDLDLLMRPSHHPRIYANRGVSGIDGFVSTAMGIALSDRALRTLAFCGDLSLLHDVNGLMPGPDPRPDITFVVINNNGGGIFSLLPQGTGVEPAAFERLFGTPHGMSIEAVCTAYQVEHVLVSSAEELTTALSMYGGVRVIEVQTDRADNAALHAKLREVTIS